MVFGEVITGIMLTVTAVGGVLFILFIFWLIWEEIKSKRKKKYLKDK